MNWNLEVKLPNGQVQTVGLAADKTPAWYMQQVGPHGYTFVRAFFVDDQGRIVWTVNTPVDEFPSAAHFNARPALPVSSITPPPAPTGAPPPGPVRVGKIGNAPRTVTNLEELEAALFQGWAPIRDNGSLMITQRFVAPGEAGAGWLADGHPLNVILGQGWIAGQKEALEAALAANQVPQPYLMLDAPELPAETALPDWLPIVGGAFALLFIVPRLFKRR